MKITEADAFTMCSGCEECERREEQRFFAAVWQGAGRRSLATTILNRLLNM
jgi:hypothetical protein